MTDFVFKSFDEMTPEDYAAIGFMAGLEIHQQLLTEKKLFCRCPAGIYSPEYDAEILRHMRPTLSELGEYDGTALMEFKTKKDIIYKIRHETVCTYEMDDTPPFELNEDALDIAIEIGILYGCNIVDEIHVARKQYLDGSIPTGFQRSAIISVGGQIPYGDRKIGITQLSIEEDACREISDIGHTREYLTDRLGMPLIETVTDPDMRTPQEIADVGNLFRYLVRGTKKVRTGDGSARQDVNVSVRGGTRIEIKGVSRLPEIPLLAYNEALRQWNLLRIREELQLRGINENKFRSAVADVTHILKNTRYEPVRNALKTGMQVDAVLLAGYHGILRRQTQTDTYFSQEISDRVRVIACLTTLPNIIHSDIPSETISTAEWQRIKKTLSTGPEDTVVLVWGSGKDVETGANEIIIRAREATIGIPSETRQAYDDGTNGFERILPGPNRMYPDTDLPPKRITSECIERITAGLQENYWSREKRYRKLAIPSDTIRSLVLSQYADLFDRLVTNQTADPGWAAVVLVQFVKRLGRGGYDVSKLTTEVMNSIFTAVNSGRIVKDGVLKMMEQICDSGPEALLNLLVPANETELVTVVREAQTQIKKMVIINPDRRAIIIIGMIMDRLRGRVNGQTVIDLLGMTNGGRDNG
ncbi:MAG: Glu-tRNA(Gln) amidotransferase subunit GatE [Candidatus Marinimicrobia bacterium]|nr:Glu-tRNA(Gln) amidotransferase subunit GatE [Candidatus Neomarinimicrobiota bacterium]